LKIGDTVIISRAGDVIPQVTKVLKNLRIGKEKEFRVPGKCPVDGSRIIHEGAIYRCSNSSCGARHREQLSHLVSRRAFNIRGLGGKIIDRFLDEGLIVDAGDIFSLKEGDIKVLERFGEKSAENIVREIVEKKKITLPRFIYSLGILNVGEETAIDLAKQFPVRSINEFLKRYSHLSKENLEKVRDIGPKVSESIHGWFREAKNLELLRKFDKAGIAIIGEYRTKKEQKFSRKTFIITGSLSSMSRDEIKEKVRALGGEISESVSKKTSYVIAGENPGSKLDKAKKLGVEILNERDFLKMLA
jgi:DNA ligase (NAD+)